MANKIQFKRGLKSTLPILSVGEPALCTDTGEVFIGGTSGNIGIAKASDLIDKLSKTTNDAITGSKIFKPNRAGFANDSGGGQLEVQGNGTDGATILFHRPGSHAVYFGLDTDNILKIGGYSFLGNKYRILDQRDLSTLMNTSGGQTINGHLSIAYPNTLKVRHIDGANGSELYLNYNNPNSRVIACSGGTSGDVFHSGNYGSYVWSPTTGTLPTGWANKVIAGGGTITIPANMFPSGTQITFINVGGVFAFIPASGVVLGSKDLKRTIDGDYASATLIHLADNSWVLIGALK